MHKQFWTVHSWSWNYTELQHKFAQKILSTQTFMSCQISEFEKSSYLNILKWKYPFWYDEIVHRSAKECNGSLRGGLRYYWPLLAVRSHKIFPIISLCFRNIRSRVRKTWTRLESFEKNLNPCLWSKSERHWKSVRSNWTVLTGKLLKFLNFLNSPSTWLW